jgi:ankyrin repeat protein
VKKNLKFHINKLVRLIVFISLLFFISLSNAAVSSEGEKLVMRAIDYVREGLIDKSTFITKDPPYMRTRVVGETKAIGIYLISHVLQMHDSAENKRLLDQATDNVVMGLMQMLKLITQGEKHLSGFIDDGAILVFLIFSSATYWYEDKDFGNKAVELINHGILDKNALVAEDGSSLLMWASSVYDCGVIDKLVKIGVDPNVGRENDNRTALIVASYNGYDDIVAILLKIGALVNRADADGKTALMLASKKGYYKVVKLLLENGAIVDLADEEGWTALMYASLNGQEEVSKILLEKGAKKDLKNKQGLTAEDLIFIRKNTSLNNENVSSFGESREKEKNESINQTYSDANSNNIKETDIYIISYAANSEYWNRWTEHYNLALKQERIASLLKIKVVCFFCKVFWNGENNYACLATP